MDDEITIKALSELESKLIKTMMNEGFSEERIYIELLKISDESKKKEKDNKRNLLSFRLSIMNSVLSIMAIIVSFFTAIYSVFK